MVRSCKQRVPPDLSDLDSESVPCEVIDDMSEVLSVKREIQELDASAYFWHIIIVGWLLSINNERARYVNPKQDINTSVHLYDPYSEMICVRCHKNKGD